MIRVLTISVSLIFYVTITLNESLAQVSGYQGKRLSLQYNVSTGFNIDRGTTFHRATDVGIHHNAEIDYVVAKHLSCYFKYRYAKLKYLTEVSGIGLPQNVFYEGKVSVQSFGIGVKMFSKRRLHLTPLGSYRTIGMDVLRFAVKKEDPTIPEQAFPEKVTGSGIGFVFAAGKNWIVADRLIINAELGFRTPTIIVSRTISPIAFDAETRADATQYITVALGLGFLAF